MIKEYYQLTKPGIIYGNIITALAGFFLSARGRVDMSLMLTMLVGLSLIIASGCVFNNIFDKDMDAKMERTRNRAMVSGSISKFNAINFGVVLLLIGVWVLFYYTNFLTLIVALFGWMVYLFFYTPLKRQTVYATLVGSIAGATPPVIGYTAIANTLDATAIILFVILAFWQMPHFYSIGIYRLNEYASANIPILPLKIGNRRSKFHIVFFIVAFAIACLFLIVPTSLGYVYFAIMASVSAFWLWFSIQGFRLEVDKLWARKMFFISLIVLLTFCLTVSIDATIKR